MVTFNDGKLLNRARMYRDWGQIGDNSEAPADRFNSVDGIPYDWKFLYGVVGYNMKGSEMSAAFGLAQLERLDGLLSKRRALIRRYLDLLAGSNYYTLPDDSRQPNWLAISLMCPDQMELLTFLEENNVQTRVCFAGNITRHPAYRQFKQEFANSDRIMAEGFLLGAHHGMCLADVDYVAGLLKDFEATKTQTH
jgi:CDP-6-deoxy-D-xylo-4-hexulose-3-dehydrase